MIPAGSNDEILTVSEKLRVSSPMFKSKEKAVNSGEVVSPIN